MSCQVNFLLVCLSRDALIARQVALRTTCFICCHWSICFFQDNNNSYNSNNNNNSNFALGRKSSGKCLHCFATSIDTRQWVLPRSRPPGFFLNLCYVIAIKENRFALPFKLTGMSVTRVARATGYCQGVQKAKFFRCRWPVDLALPHKSNMSF